MKKLALLIAVMLLVSAFTFAVDFSASTNLGGSLWGTDGFKLDNSNQKDADLLTVSVSDEVWGSDFRLWAPILTGTDDGAVSLRNLAIWVKPVSMLKITVGSIGSGLYTEQLDWWQVPNGAMSTGMGWDGDSATSGKGVNFELTPISDLWILAGISPGIDTPFMAKDVDDNLVVGPDTNFGLAAKYTITDFGSVGVSYRNNGGMTAGDGTVTWDTQKIRVGFDVNAVSGLYAFLQGIIVVDQGDESISGVVIDNYAAYTAGDFYVKGTFPVTIRLTGDAGDDNYMSYDVKTGYTVMENVTPYLRITQQNNAIILNDFTFMPSIQLGADYSLGSVSFNTAVQINVPDPDDSTAELTWSIPFSMRASW